jgi:ribosomal-protein-alanine N-acetyltransferase
MTMQTGRLTLREVTMDDVYTLFELFSMDYVQQADPYMPKTVAGVVEYIQFRLDNMQSSNRTHYDFIVELRQEAHKFVGVIGYSFVGEGVYELECFAEREHWGGGYMSEALKRLLTHAFETGKVKKIFAMCQTENIGAERVMVKCGMRKSADQPKPKEYHGVPKDRIKYEITAAEWGQCV